MTSSYVFMAGDPVCVEAAAGRLTEMYTILNGHWMYNILRMLETLATGLKTISLKGTADLETHYAAINKAPIATDRMRIAVTAVALAGKVGSLRFQRDYESALAMVPNQQRQEILQFLHERAPSKSEDIPIQMDLSIFAQKTAWRINTSSGVAASVGYFSNSAGYIYLYHGSEEEGQEYTYSYYGMGVGKSISEASLTVSLKSFPGGGLGRLYRSGTRLADLSPRSFEGLGAIVSVSAGASKMMFGFNVSVSFLMLAMVDTMNAFSDLNRVPRSAGAFGFLWGPSLGMVANKSVVDVGISWQMISVFLAK